MGVSSDRVGHEVLEALLEARVLSQMSDDGATPDLEEVEEAEAAAAAEAGEDGDEGEEGEAARAPRLVVSGEIYEGTVVGIGWLALVVDRRIDHCTLRESEGRIQVFPFIELRMSASVRSWVPGSIWEPSFYPSASGGDTLCRVRNDPPGGR
ncbi:MAG TPA: hypothetical protein QGH28_04855 [Chloroflexota bacterium]|nr:hypothetical protein [Chloroflexota bacterium]